MPCHGADEHFFLLSKYLHNMMIVKLRVEEHHPAASVFSSPSRPSGSTHS